MVIEDLSYSSQANNKHPLNRLASIQDRFLAFIFDFLFLSPMIVLINFPLLKKIKLGLMLGETDDVIGSYLALVAMISVLSIILYQVASFYFYGASFGQKIFQIYLVSTNPQNKSKINLSQAIQYSIGFILSFLFLGIPFLSVITHRQGQTFYQRISEINVLSFKEIQTNPVSEFEIRFVKQWINMIIIFIIALLATFVGHNSFQNIKLSHNSKHKPNEICENKIWNQLNHEQRLIKYFTIYLTEQKSDTITCLEHLIEEHAWSGIKIKDQSILYIVKYFISKNEETQQLYINELCRDLRSESCQIIQSIEKDQLHTKYLSTQHLWVKILLIDELLKNSKYIQAFDFIKNDEEIVGYEKYYSQVLAKIYYSFKQKQKQNSRSPASLDEHPIEKRFKEFFGVQ